MAVRLIGEHWEGDVFVRWWGCDASNTVTIERIQDTAAIVDHVASVNADGGAKAIDGFGVPLGEAPQVPMFAYCLERGINVNDFQFKEEYRDEFKRFLKHHPKLAYDYSKTFHAVVQ